MAVDWRPTCSLEALRARAGLLRRIREFFSERGVLEVHTSVLAAHTVTDPNVESIVAGNHGYLQTSPEYQLKRLLAGGAPSLYQLGPAFRSGESGRHHNPEFTLLEWYRIGFTDVTLMAEVAELVSTVLGPAEYHTLSYQSLVVDLEQPADNLDLAFAEAIAALGPGRYFVTHYPAAQAALARLHPETPDFAARFELIVDGLELANGYYELTDPAEQRRRFAEDLEQRRRLGVVLPALDERFLAALESGLPDCAGVALGIDRLLMLKLEMTRISDVMPFPAGHA